MDIVYCAYVREQRFINHIQSYMPPEIRHAIMQGFDPNGDFIRYTDAVVFVGTQLNNFSPYPEAYFSTLDLLLRNNVPTVVIPRENDRPLPQRFQNKVGLITRVNKSVQQIASELSGILIR